MAFTSVATHSSSVATASAASISVAPTPAIAVGKLAIVCVVTDNYATADGETNEHSSISDTHSHSWTKLRENTDTDGVAADGVTISMWATKIATELLTPDTIQANFAHSVACRIISVISVSFGGAWALQTVGVGQSAIEATVSGMPSREYFLVGHGGAEGTDAAKTPDADYTERFDLRTGSSGSQTTQHVVTRIATLTTDTCTSSAWTNTNPTFLLAAIYEPSGDMEATVAATSDVNATLSVREAIRLSASGNFVDGDATTAQLEAPSGKSTSDFSAGKMGETSNPLTVDIGSGKYTELEWSLIADDYADGFTYEFQIVVSPSTPLDTYSVTPEWEIGEPSGSIAATVPATSGVTATLTGTGALAATVPATSGVNAVIKGIAPIAATVGATTGVTATLTGTGSLASTVPATSGVTASLTGTGNIASTVPATSGVSAALTGRGTLEATVPATTSVTATIKGIAPILATISSTSGVSATLTGTGALASTISALAGINATLTGTGALASTISALGGVTATLIGIAPISATVPATTGVTATLSEKGMNDMEAIVTATTGVVATLTGIGTMAATISATGGVTATLTATGYLAATIPATASVTATLTGRGNLAATVPATTATNATLKGWGALAATIAATSSVVANLTGEVQGAISATISAVTSVIATLTGTGNMSATVPAWGDVIATLKDANAPESPIILLGGGSGGPFVRPDYEIKYNKELLIAVQDLMDEEEILLLV